MPEQDTDYPFREIGDRVTVNCLWDSRHGTTGTVREIAENELPYGTGLCGVDFGDGKPLSYYDGTELKNFSE